MGHENRNDLLLLFAPNHISAVVLGEKIFEEMVSRKIMSGKRIREQSFQDSGVSRNLSVVEKMDSGKWSISTYKFLIGLILPE